MGEYIGGEMETAFERWHRCDNAIWLAMTELISKCEPTGQDVASALIIECMGDMLTLSRDVIILERRKPTFLEQIDVNIRSAWGLGAQGN